MRSDRDRHKLVHRVTLIAMTLALLAAACGQGDAEPADDNGLVGDVAGVSPTVVSDGGEISDAEQATAIEDDVEADAPSAADTPAPTAAVRATAVPAEPTPTPQADAPPTAGDPSGPSDAATGLLSSASTPAVSEPFLWRTFDNLWRVEVLGVSLGELPSFSSAEGVCYSVFVVATPIEIEDGDLLSGLGPQIGLRSDGLYRESGGICEESQSLAAEGFSASIGDRPGVVGASLNYAVSVQIEDVTAPALESIVVGDPDRDTVLTYIEPVIFETPPAPRLGADIQLPSLQPIVGTTTEGVEAFIGIGAPDDAEELWDITFAGVVVEELSQFGIEQYGAGSCVTVVGTVTLAQAAFGQSAIARPKVHLLAGGRKVTQDGSTCFSQDLEERGYRWLAGASVSEGTTYHFAEAFRVHEFAMADLSAVIVEDFPPVSPARAFTPDIVSVGDLPPVTVLAGAPIEAADGEMAGASFVWRELRDEVAFDVTLHGVVDAGPNRRGDGTCYIAFGTYTPQDELVNSGSVPELSMFASGLNQRAAQNVCDNAPWEDLGYQYLRPSGDLPVVGETVHFFAPVLIDDFPARELEVLLVGDAGSPGTFIFVPSLIDAPPAL